MQKNTFLPAVLAIAATVVYFFALSSREKALTKALEFTTVAVAAADLPARTVLSSPNIDVVQMPRKYMDQDALEVKSAQDLKLLENLVTQIRIPKGNQITQSSLIALNARAGIAVKVPPDYRSMVLSVDRDLLRVVKPSDRVDILVTFEAVMADGHKERVTATILQNIMVLGVGSDLGQGRSAEEEKTRLAGDRADEQWGDRGPLYLALNMAEAQYLALSLKQGDISVSVRGLGDTFMHPIDMASYQSLFRSR